MSESGPKPILDKYNSQRKTTGMMPEPALLSDLDFIDLIKAHKQNSVNIRYLLADPKNLKRLSDLWSPSQILQLGLDQTAVLEEIYSLPAVQAALLNPDKLIVTLVNDAFLKGGAARMDICCARLLYTQLKPEVIAHVVKEDYAFFESFETFDDELRGLLSIDHYVDIGTVHHEFAIDLLKDNDFLAVATREHLYALAKASHRAAILIFKTEGLWLKLSRTHQLALSQQYSVIEEAQYDQSKEVDPDEPQEMQREALSAKEQDDPDLANALEELSFEDSPKEKRKPKT